MILLEQKNVFTFTKPEVTMKKTVIFLLIFISHALYSQSRPIESIPFELEKNHIFIYIKVNKIDSLKFLFDTGANGTCINKEAVGKAKLKIDGISTNMGSNGTNEVEESSGNDIFIGNIHKKGVILAIIEIGSTSIDGVMGTDLMSEHIIEIDYQKQMINFYDENDKTINYKDYTKLKMSDAVYPTCVKSTIIVDGKKHIGLFGIDTGAQDALTLASPFTKKNNFIAKTKKIGAVHFQGSDGSKYKLPVSCPEVLFAGKHLYNIPTALSNSTEGIDATDKLAGFFGNAFLKKFDIILDYKNHFIYFKINKNLYSDFYEIKE
jgi:hypothetical protein